MPIVRIIKDWDWPDLLRQSPEGRGEWKDIRLVLDDTEKHDYVVILNRVPRKTAVHCSPERIWELFQEPPCPEHKRLPTGMKQFSRVYSQDASLRNCPFVNSQPALVWHVGRGYDCLVECKVPPKDRGLSWVTSNLASTGGHRRRMNFLKRVRGKIDFDLLGRGFSPIDDKWDALAPYRYSLAVENYQGPYYWSEKLADCFLAWTMPIYSGCTNITKYFPADSMVVIDIDAPDVVEQIRETVASDRWKRNRDAIAHARRLVLDRYQLFPFLAAEIAAHEAREGIAAAPERIVLSGQTNFGMNPAYRLWRSGMRAARRVLKRLPPSHRGPEQ